MTSRSDQTTLPATRRDLEMRAELAACEADFLARRAHEFDRWGIVLGARECRHDARAHRIAGLLFLGQAAAAPA